jgi:hypothetical protein
MIVPDAKEQLMFQGFHIEVLPIHIQGLYAHPDAKKHDDHPGNNENQD